MKPHHNNIIYFAETNEKQGENRVFGQYVKDKIYHTIISGKTGTGKSNLLETMILGEIENNVGSVVVFDPNGDLIHKIIGNCPDHRKKDVIHIDPANHKCQYGYNPLKRVHEDFRPLVVSGILEIFNRLYGSSWGNRLEHILRHCITLLLEQGHATLADIPKLLVDEQFRYKCRLKTKSKYSHDFWLNEFPKYRAEALLPLLSKLGSFLNHPAIIRSIVDPKVDISLRHIIDNKKIILVSISKGQLGGDISSLIGSVLINSLTLAVYSRAYQPEWKRAYTSLYIDEVHNFTTSALVSAFSEVRKYGLAMTVATQYLSALKPEIRDAILGNAGSIMTFRVSYDEARVLAKYFHPTFKAEDIAGLPNHYIFLVMMINGTVSVPFSAKTIRYMDRYR